MITNTELRLWVTAMKIELELDDCMPDVGMGPSNDTLFKRVWKRTDLPLKEQDQREIINIFEKERGK